MNLLVKLSHDFNVFISLNVQYYIYCNKRKSTPIDVDFLF
ncbi:hypothetical protein PMI13_00621 [Chryseobacterium populi]|uniref:Uncharacterized protein n=1 Tax=Chryseobacterium populi TaxID=1144316 RepID=J3CNA6_9FLAO|nr:hypothetical protein PMI13_00621 [Chryseobacterium populi]